MTAAEILSRLPYSEPFLFVDEIISVSPEGMTGTYVFKEESYFYQGHFKDFPVTPGVILTECCAQIGVVSLGIYLLLNEEGQTMENLEIGMSGSEMEFYIPVLPGEKVTVVSEKVYFRFNKLKCRVKMFNETQDLVCKGILAGMVGMKDNNG